jgi:FkbM family methyltransferase
MSIAQILYHPDFKFLSACTQYAQMTKSQNFQDVFALYANDFLGAGGYYIEFGATNGIDGSNTLMLQNLRWGGILAEPNPTYYKQLLDNRSFVDFDGIRKGPNKFSNDAVYTTTGDEVEFLITDEADLSTIKGYGQSDEHRIKRLEHEVVRVKTITLYDLLWNNAAPLKINYLSIDTEGTEYVILEKFFRENKRYTIKAITVEHNYQQDVRNKLYRLLTENGYKQMFSDVSRWDDFYMLEDK